MKTDPPVLVIGGTRGTGLLIARLLHREGRRVRVLARNPARARTLFHSSVEIVCGEITKPGTLRPAIDGAHHIVFTAGCRSGYPVRERQVKEVEFEGVLHTLDAARNLGFRGRFLYMNASGLNTPSLLASCLNLWKGNTLVWRRRAEDAIRASRMDYTIIRTGVLLNQPGGRHLIRVTQVPLPLSFRHRIARADVAQIFLAALEHIGMKRVTFEAVWDRPGQPGPGTGLLQNLRPDGPPESVNLDVSPRPGDPEQH